MREVAPPFRFRLIAALFLVLLWAACSDQASDPAALDGPTTLAVTQREMARALPSALRLQREFTNELLALPGVVGTAVALGDDGLPTVAALVEHGGVSVPPGVRVIVTGRLSALDWQANPQAKPCGKGKNAEECPSPGEDDPPVDEPDPTERHPRPVPIGVSTGHPAITAGTIGARVKAGNKVWALSNNHVYAATDFFDCNPDNGPYNCRLGDPVIQPGAFDGGTLVGNPTDEIGTVAAKKKIVFGACTPATTDANIMDAAIALSDRDELDNTTPSAGYGTPKSATMPAALDMRVKKFGRTTGQTKGRIIAINATLNVNYGAAGVACFTGQIVISPASFSSAGDSGSLVVFDRKGRASGVDGSPVGLLFAGGFSTTIISPIDAILEEFGVTIDGS